MYSRIVIDGNAFYELDEECMKKKKEECWTLKQLNQEKKKWTDSDRNKTGTS